MRNLLEIKAIFSDTELLAANQIAQIKGGVAAAAIANSGAVALANPNSAVAAAAPTDDKRRPRPGGGASTQLASTT
jgi:hypothetical protein